MTRNIIVGTDWSSDCDDVVAMRLFCRAHQKGTIRLLGINIDDNIPMSVRSLSAFLTAEKIDVPIGFDRKAKRVCFHPRYQERMCTSPSKLTNNNQAEESVALYRRLIAGAEEPVEIVEIGYTQALAALLKSSPDRYSPLTGYELIQRKVKKFWLMAGKWDLPGQKEHNLTGTRATRRGGAYLLKHCPVPITLLGWEVGNTVLIGGNLPEGDMVRNAIIDYGCDPALGRDGWDPMLAHLAIVGDEKEAGYDVVKGKARLSALTGKNYFVAGPGNHLYVVKRMPDQYYIDRITPLL